MSTGSANIGGMNAIRLACATLLPLLAACASTAAPHAQPWDNARQLIVVTTTDWNAPTGTLRAFEREGDGWRETTSGFTVNVGRSGAGWGLGLHDARDQDAGPVKREGDGRAPAGARPSPSRFTGPASWSRASCRPRPQPLPLRPTLTVKPDVVSRQPSPSRSKARRVPVGAFQSVVVTTINCRALSHGLVRGAAVEAQAASGRSRAARANRNRLMRRC